jgi:hypothetical protein
MISFLGHSGPSQPRTNDERESALESLAKLAGCGPGWLAPKFLGLAGLTQSAPAAPLALSSAEVLALFRPHMLLQPDGSIIAVWNVDGALQIALRIGTDGKVVSE